MVELRLEDNWPRVYRYEPPSTRKAGGIGLLAITQEAYRTALGGDLRYFERGAAESAIRTSNFRSPGE